MSEEDPSLSSDGETKDCPFCAEPVLDSHHSCAYCGLTHSPRKYLAWKREGERPRPLSLRQWLDLDRIPRARRLTTTEVAAGLALQTLLLPVTVFGCIIVLCVIVAVLAALLGVR
ncbi:MAG: hypothetical protein HN396_18130 [Gemmatimonadales bacterium]|jgi:hypothetical protein|nr:hypothetical protein [Gemmatimonadales bacterium]